MNENNEIRFFSTPLEKDPHMMELINLKRERYFIKRPRDEINDFLDVPEEKRKKDEEMLLEKEKEFEIELKKLKESEIEKIEFQKELSGAFEVCIFDIIEINSLLGQNCKVYPASKWDDVFNGIDGVFILDKEEQNEYLGGIEIDVTFSSKSKKQTEEGGLEKNKYIEKKIESIRQSIRRGDLSTLEYFKDPKTKEHKIISLPKVILGAEKKSVEPLLKMWAKSIDDQKELFKNHPILSKIINELLVQLKSFAEFAKDLCENTRDSKMSEKYNNIYLKYAHMNNYIYNNVYLPNLSLIKSHENDIESDEVYRQIINILYPNILN